jgi:hypothetical protein
MEGALVALVALAPFPYPHSLSPCFFLSSQKRRGSATSFFFRFATKSSSLSRDPARRHAGGKQRRSHQLLQQACVDVAKSDDDDDVDGPAPEPLAMRSRRCCCRCFGFRCVCLHAMRHLAPISYRRSNRAPTQKRELFFFSSSLHDR